MTAGRTDHTKFAQGARVPADADRRPAGPVALLGPEPQEYRGTLTLCRDGSWSLQFADEATLLPGEVFESTLRRIP